LEAEKFGAELDINAFNAMIAAVARVGNLAAAQRWLQRAREAGEETGGQRHEVKY
jgi:dsRNA-specific ribonuclease